MSEHQYDIRTSESCVDPNPLMVERQDPDNFTRFQTRERCALEVAAYVFNTQVPISCVDPESFVRWGPALTTFYFFFFFFIFLFFF